MARAPAIHQLCCIVLYRCCIGLLYRHRINEELLSDVGAGRLLYRCCIVLYRCCIACCIIFVRVCCITIVVTIYPPTSAVGITTKAPLGGSAHS